MGETCLPDQERRPLLSNSCLATSRTHSRSASYGSYLPRYSLDTQQLKRLLPDDVKASKVFEAPFYSGLEEVCPSQHSIGNHEEEAPVPPAVPPWEKGHSHKDSLIESDVLFTDTYFLKECEKQLISLFDHISTHLSQISTEIDQHKLMMAHRHAPVHGVVINEDLEDKASIKSDSYEDDASSIGGDSGIEDDHLTSPKGFLSRIREVVNSLRSSLETTVQQLDEMVGLYDERTNGNLGRLTLSKHNNHRDSLQEQLKYSLQKIDKELEDLQKKESDDLKIATISLRARSEGLGCTGVMAFCLLLVTILFMTFLAGYFPSERWIIVLRLLRSPLTIVLFMFLFGFNLMAWTRVKIDYIRIFDFPLDGVPTPQVMFRIASIFTILFSFLSIVCFVSNHHFLYITDKAVALSMWLTLLLFLFNPLKIFYRSSRYALVLVMVRILIAPLPRVKFGDFWLADQTNSMIPLLLDLQFLLCYSGMSTWNKSLQLRTCTSSNNGIIPIISCLPALWRFMQCLRCFQRTRQIAHLINAVKYFTTFPVVIFALIFSLKVNPTISFSKLTFKDVGWIIILWFISSLVHALYTFFWDIKMDWGLFCFNQGTILRPKLYYPKWVYIIAIVFDFVVRFACAVKLTLAIVYHIDSDVIYFILIIAELLRRWVWNFFRIEHEEIIRSAKL